MRLRFEKKKNKKKRENKKKNIPPTERNFNAVVGVSAIRIRFSNTSDKRVHSFDDT